MHKATQAEMSLRDVEPVKTLIGDMADIRNSIPEGDPVRVRMDEAFRRFNTGFGSADIYADTSIKDRMGWRIPKDKIYQLNQERWPSVLIVIPVYNNPKLLKQCLVSLMRTNYPGEVMYSLVDNASTDPETLRVLAEQPVVHRFDEPVSFAKAVNTGMQAAEADYYVLFNQDCRISAVPGRPLADEEWLTWLINWMEGWPSCGIAGSKLLYPDGRLQHSGITIRKGQCGRNRVFNGDPDIPEANYYEKMQAVTGAVYCIRGKMMREIGGLDEGYMFGCEDTEYCLRAGALGWETWYVPHSVVVHHENAVRKSVEDDRIRRWVASSNQRFRERWGPHVDFCDGGRAVIVDRLKSAAAERLKYMLLAAGVNAKIVTDAEQAGSVDVLVTFSAPVRRGGAGRRIYFLQDTPSKESLGLTEYELFTTRQDLADMAAKYGRTCKVVSSVEHFARNILLVPAL